jgi:hypothetical protein
MTDVSPARRLMGRALLAGGALALPLTASFSYAASAQDSEVVPVPVAPSAAPEAPLPPEAPVPPAAPDAPQPPAAPEAPVPPDAAHGERHVQRFVLRHPDGKDGDKREQHVFVIRTDGPLSEAQRKHFEEMRKEWEKKGAEWRAEGDKWRKTAEGQRQFALAHVPEVSADCDKAGEDGARSWTDDSGRQHVVICQRIIRDRAQTAEHQAQFAEGRALMSLRMARNTVAGNAAIGDSVKQEVLADLDKEIARLEAEK